MEFYKANLVAEPILELIRRDPGVERAEIVGSIRRQRTHVKDIEILIEPRMVIPEDMFGKHLPPVPMTQHIDWLKILDPAVKIKGGLKYKQFELESDHGKINLDLFICIPPGQWGVLKLIRTGPWQFSRYAVTPQDKGGWLRPGHFVKGGQIHVIGQASLETSTEEAFFDCLTIDYMEPKKRDYVY